MGTDSGDVGIERVEEFADDHHELIRFGRVGWFAKGLVYILTGVLALLVGVHAIGGSSTADDEASQTGAVARIAENPLGVVLLVVLAAGLVVYALWHLFSVLLPADGGVQGWFSRLGFVVSAIASLSLAWTAVAFVRDPGKPADGEDSKVESYTKTVMEGSFGRAAVFVIGGVLIVIAVVFVTKAVSASFEDQLHPGSVGFVSHRAIVVLGRIGWMGRAGMMALIGFFLCRSAIRFDPDDAQGLDGSLRKAASAGAGSILVIAVGAGLLVFGLYCTISASKRRLVGADV